MPEPSPLFVRLATLDDAEAIRAIYNREVTGSTVTFDLRPRTLEDQRDWLEAHAGIHPAVVAVAGGGVVGGGVVGGGVVGFGSLSPYRDRPAYSTTVEDSVYVDAAARGQGAGWLLLAELVRLAGLHGFHSVVGRIVGGHQASIALHRACGFELVGVEREVGRKFGRWLDVVVMQHLLGPDGTTTLAPRPPVLDVPDPPDSA
ncbi:MAG: GNAT family N-acetyltransferase [Acidimicrobiales bacterium]